MKEFGTCSNSCVNHRKEITSNINLKFSLNNKNLIVGFDLDGVLTVHNNMIWEQEVLKHYPDKIYKRSPKTKFPDEVAEKYSLDKEEVNELFDDPGFCNNIFEQISPQPRAAETTRKLKEKGYEIAIITARTEATGTYDWLAKHGIIYDHLIHDHEKVRAINQADFELGIYFEDSLKYVNAICEEVPTVLINDEYYPDAEDQVDNKVIQATDLHEVQYLTEVAFKIQNNYL